MNTDSFLARFSLTRFSRPLAVLATIVILVASFGLVDSLTAAHVEHRLSQTVKENSRLATTPAVYVGGVPFAQVLVTENIPHLSVNALDVDIEDLGIVNASTDIYNVELPASAAYSGDVVGHVAELMKRRVSLDGVALGQFLGMTDLDIANPYDISPGGGVASEAQLTGTLPGMSEKTSVIVSLRLDGPMFRMDPIEIITSGEEPGIVQAGYSLEFDTRELPLAAQANLVQLSGGSIIFEAERRNITLRPSDLTPVETGDSEFTDYPGSHEQ
ncbi:LmeA family phospholipid-binding protein [Corynebacterium cystitidis]|uniref:DUF2993 domain-containing protein n=1 Tax=Corynebacterium cystitidis DSM 20524 TaxID=1121357 RepID=A0A1H9W1L6_9CORY|nr:DUF2993 domain-containing protein [Corynebacterium cystitidis]WJY82986.1 hypothetical protein CCYS_10380 [Corynebacterium cystitidis DSM 20524]SES27812.1 Protein of unknown function [Corynebacterium cystitidis DSM 20524]SNV64560.1 putative secreted protein [Corynebacterium cystitidis]